MQQCLDCVPLATLQRLVRYWRDAYDWRRYETLLNSWPSFRTTIFGVAIHFLHIRSRHERALPLLLTHGWPGSVLEFRHVVEPLTEPKTASGGGGAEEEEEAEVRKEVFHLVIPSLPGFGFSGKPEEAGWNPGRIARAWAVLMERLGYERWVAQGGDWGADVTAELGRLAPPGLIAIHMNSLFYDVKKEIKGEPSNEELKALKLQEEFDQDEAGYANIQMTRPQTLGYGLVDSPVGQAAWIYEKFHGWSHHDGNVESVFSKDEMLDTIMLYWLTNSAASSARIYWEKLDTNAIPITIPVGASWFPGDQTFAPRQWCERYYSNLIHWKEVEKGGHFAAWEQPGIFVREIQDCFRKVLK
ncbi:epoxide hydrolase [Viridothelium virens]|uniref:Epoxide hydrolase n=1 Tax=Viridothelium virens TaxID=1048519 RepID=A0A6A6HJI8_VIRVR|nr:epoxide hydrolase [Viridothelium virens]